MTLLLNQKNYPDLTQSKITASVLGFVIGDALGVPVEFFVRETIRQDPVLSMRGYGTHGQLPGTWSDDSSLVFCLMESLIRKYNLTDISKTMVQWLYEGYWTPFGKVFDVGLSTKKAISKIRRGLSPTETGGFGIYDNGNGGLMRILPLVFFLKPFNKQEKFQIIKEVSSITHSHSVSIIGAQLYVLLGQYILEGHSIIDSYKKSSKEMFEYYKNSEYKKSLLCYKRLLFQNIGSLSVDKIKSSGYIVDTLEAVFWSLLNSDSYKKAVLLAVNLGEDTDTIGALTGGLAGLKYGYGQIPEIWINQLARKNDIKDLIERFKKSLT
ncbi:MAG: ADP-ribosylglycohydrolase family protein [Bacteroidales bacterium]|jgi:ADP-ribosyl-[dinitrogen reductase] hydrolase|nr:ADP-ribosylglycohydrolase family protein [Bacteroidales bacterium]